MSGISNLFENLMTYNDVNNSKKCNKTINNNKTVIKEEDSTLLNLTVELPTDTEEITPEDVKVDVGIMTVDTDGVSEDKKDNETVEEPTEGEEMHDITPESEDEEGGKSEDESDKEESLDLTQEAAKICTDKEDCECKDCKSKKESLDEKSLDKAIDKYFDGNVKKWNFINDEKDKVKVIFKDNSEDEFSISKFEEANSVDTAIKNIRKRVANNTVTESKNNVKVKNLKVGNKLLIALSNDKEPKVRTIKELPSEGVIVFSDGSHVELKPNDFVTLSECSTKKESLLRLDTTSLNKLFTQFVRDNYKNIDKIVISKAILENKVLKLEGKIYDLSNKFEKVSFTNRGFDATKLENKRFIMDFKDNLGTFGVIKESIKKPFIFVANLKEGILHFENLKYSFKTKYESKTAKIYGNINYIKETIEPKKENSEQIKKFNEIAETIKNAKTTDELYKCKDSIDDSNVGDTLMSALQMIWDDVNSRIAQATQSTQA